jgi:hypothetical protein
MGADYLVQFFGIEPRRQRRPADQVAEHHRLLPAPRRRAGRLVSCRDGSGSQASNCFWHCPAMTDRGDAQVLGGTGHLRGIARRVLDGMYDNLGLMMISVLVIS